jgi:microsomal dipeptidase-like Zn-dependent dipeptidase
VAPTQPASTGLIATAFCAFALSACGESTPLANGAAPAVSAVAPLTRYDLANGCFGLKSIVADAFVRRAGAAYRADPAASATTEPFFLKPTALGKYLLFRNDARYVAVSGDGVGTVASASDASDWTVDTIKDGIYTITSESAGKRIAVDAGQLVLTDPASAGESAQMAFVPTTSCATFPEITVNATGDTFKGRGVDKPALGFVDAHVHMIVGPEFDGGFLYGLPFHRFGVEQALGNCESVHGPNGRRDIIGNFQQGTPLGTHDTQGWPTFKDWPAQYAESHTGTYYKWIERAWKGGLRLMVNDLVQNQTLCEIQSIASATTGQNCNEMDGAELQAQRTHELQDYIDAQEGGPGKGWFRIVTSPAEARRVINEGKLAVILGLEISHLFDCGIRIVAGQETTTCSDSQIDQQLDRMYALGVREAFLTHEFNNAFAGNGLFNGLILNVGNRYDTGEFWKTYDCPAGEYWSDPGAIMDNGLPPGFGSDPFTTLLIEAAGGALPLYNTTNPQCNARGITPLGEYAMQKMMERGIILNTDHMEVTVKDRVIEIAEAQTPLYPLISTHGSHGGTTMDQARRLLALGGVIFPYHDNGRMYVRFIDQLRPLFPAGALFGVGFGKDTNGLGGQADPRIGDDVVPVQYPFTLFHGADWGPEFAGMTAVTFDQQVSGVDVYNVDTDGGAHYGLLPDFVEQVRLEGGEEALRVLFNSAEAYLQMWERTCARNTGSARCE